MCGVGCLGLFLQPLLRLEINSVSIIYITTCRKTTRRAVQGPPDIGPRSLKVTVAEDGDDFKSWLEK